LLTAELNEDAKVYINNFFIALYEASFVKFGETLMFNPDNYDTDWSELCKNINKMWEDYQ
jgi:hypothetical protein